MKVALVCPYDLAAVGGVQGQVVSLVAWLREAGHEAWAVGPGAGGPPGTRHVGTTFTVPINRSRAPVTLDPRAVAAVREAVAGADIVHIHEPLVPLAAAAAVLVSRAPRVGTFHADPGPVVTRLYRGAAPLLRRLLRRLSVATAVSPVAAAAVAPFVGARVVPNGIDTARYRSAAGRVAGRVLFLGRDDPRKGLDDLLQAWPLVRSAVPAAELHVVGAQRAGGPEGVFFLGRKDEQDKLRELAAAEILCAPNLGGESFGLIVTEGMAAGCAVVASDLPAFRFVAGGTARLVRPGYPPALAEALIAVLGQPGKAAEMGAAAQREAARFDRAATLAGYLAAYRDALSGSGTGSPGADASHG